MSIALLASGAIIGRLTAPARSSFAHTNSVWDGERPIADRPPFRVECRFHDVPTTVAWPAHALCLADKGDRASDDIRLGNSKCDALRPLWDEPLLSQRTEDVYVDLGAGRGECVVAMAAAGIHTIALESDPRNLFRFTSSVIANRLRGNVTLYTRPEDGPDVMKAIARSVKDARVRLLRVSDSSSGSAADVLQTLPTIGRTVLIDVANVTRAREPCKVLEKKGYIIYDGGQRRKCADISGSVVVGHFIRST